MDILTINMFSPNFELGPWKNTDMNNHFISFIDNKYLLYD